MTYLLIFSLSTLLSLPSLYAISVSTGQDHSCALYKPTDSLSSINGIQCWGNTDVSLCDHWHQSKECLPQNMQPIDLGADFKPIQISSGSDHCCSLSSDHRIRCWGDNLHGQLGNGARRYPSSSNLNQTDLGTHFDAISIVTGYCHSCALSADNKVKCWGCNDYAQLGQSDHDNRGKTLNQMGDNLLPLQFPSDFKVMKLAAGKHHSCALSEDGRVLCWGFNRFLQIGYKWNTQTIELYKAHPIPIKIDDFIPSDIACGEFHTCLLSEDHRVRCYGKNESNQLGVNGKDGTIDFGDDFEVIQITAGSDHSCALSINKEIKCWGSNQFGQLGQSDMINRAHVGNETLPIDLGAEFNDIQQIESGAYHSCAVSGNDEVKCWGKNHKGQLGLNHSIKSYGTNSYEMGDHLPKLRIQTISTPSVIDLVQNKEGVEVEGSGGGDDEGDDIYDDAKKLVLNLIYGGIGFGVFLFCMVWLYRRQEKKKKKLHWKQAKSQSIQIRMASNDKDHDKYSPVKEREEVNLEESVADNIDRKKCEIGVPHEDEISLTFDDNQETLKFERYE